MAAAIRIKVDKNTWIFYRYFIQLRMYILSVIRIPKTQPFVRNHGAYIIHMHNQPSCCFVHDRATQRLMSSELAVTQLL